MARVKDLIASSVRAADKFDPGVQVRPACILWPDGERQWEAAMPALQAILPELLVLGSYEPRARRGPAIWLRCAIDRQADDVALPGDRTPILYVPGYSREDLRAVESCPEHLLAIAELQYRGTFWSQANGKDWTVTAFLKAADGGLGLDVAQDADTRRAAQSAILRLVDADVASLSGKRLDKAAFGTLLVGGDPVRETLMWIDSPEAYRSERTAAEWHAFADACRDTLGLDPGQAGVLEAAALLAARDGAWAAVWTRYCEAPALYPGVPARIRQCPVPAGGDPGTTATHGGWPQWNEARERALRTELSALADVPEHDARTRVRQIEEAHAPRRDLVWANLGEAPLARALEHLAVLADVSGASLAAGTLEELEAAYGLSGWRADDAVLQALAWVDEPADVQAVSAAVRALYLPWAQDAASHLQTLLWKAPQAPSSADPSYGEGDCVLFVDGLRFDLARRLTDLLGAAGCQIQRTPTWALLPTVTATAKPGVSPVRGQISGLASSSDFEPVAKATGHSLRGGYVLKKLMQEAGWITLARDETGDGKGRAWTEIGTIDHEGHERGRKIARQISGILLEVRRRVTDLLGAGWSRVLVVTDHGWLLLPGGLPKIDLPAELTENKWRRFATLKPGAVSKERLFSWSWNPESRFAIAQGVHCYQQGLEYTHGGLSLQESLTLRLSVTRDEKAAVGAVASIQAILWKGLRCTVTVAGNSADLYMDVRMNAGNPASSLLQRAAAVAETGTASALVLDHQREGETATVVLTDAGGGLVAQQSTVVGGGK